MPTTPIEEAVDQSRHYTRCRSLIPGSWWEPYWASHPEHAACLAALEDCKQPFTNAHALAETFATGFYRVPTEAAAELTLGLRDSIQVEALALADYETSIREALSRGVMGGGIHDSLHAPSRAAKRRSGS